jgi:hypothetical protein
MTQALSLPLPAEWLEQLAVAVSDRLQGRLDERASPWLTRQAAADYLGVPVSRLEKDRTVPCRRWDGRVLYDRVELDEFVRSKERP